MRDIRHILEEVGDLPLSALQDDELAHYGVLGMKWGVRKDRGTKPARPAKPKLTTQQKRNARAQKYIKRADIFGKRISELEKEVPKNWFAKRSQQNVLKDLRAEKARALKDAELKKQGKLSTAQKRLVIGAAVVGAVITAKVAHDGLQSGEFRRLAEKGKLLIQGKDVARPFRQNLDLANKAMNSTDAYEKIVKKVNPGFGEIGTKMNCRRATMAYEMRRRGFDVIATRTTNSHSQNNMGMYNVLNKAKVDHPLLKIIKEHGEGANRPYSDFVTKTSVLGKNLLEFNDGDSATDRASTIFKSLATQPSGSRGEVGVRWLFGGGHSMAYEIFNGKPVIFDNQTGKMFSSAEEFVKAGMDVSAAGFSRLDDVDLNMDFLMRWVRNA